MPELSMSAAVRAALEQILDQEPRAFLIGEDIGVYGGAFKITRGFVDRFGPERIVDTPICEGGFVGVACGAALLGGRPIIEIMFMDFLTLAMDNLINVAVKWHDTYGPDFAMPILIRAPAGAGRSYGPTHSQSFEGVLLNVPGLTICCPSTPADAAGMLLGAFARARPTVFVEHKALYGIRGPVPEPLTPIPVGQAVRRREGGDISVFCYGRQVATALAAADLLAREGIQADVIDLRSLKPLDVDAVRDSIRRTGRGLSVEESPLIGGIGAELSAVVMAEAFDYLEAPFGRLGAAEAPIPCAPALEQQAFPTVESVAARMRQLVTY